MLLESTIRDLLLATWIVPGGAVARKLPAGIEPELTGAGEALLSLVGARAVACRARGKPVPGFSQLTLRTYVIAVGEPSVFFLSLRTTLPGLAGSLYGFPVRPARIRVEDGLVRARGLGVSLRYARTGAPADVPRLPSGPLGHHDVATFFAAGLRRLQTRHDEFRWEAAELLEPPRLDALVALGFDVGEPSSLLYAAATGFDVELPAQNVADFAP